MSARSPPLDDQYHVISKNEPTKNNHLWAEELGKLNNSGFANYDGSSSGDDEGIHEDIVPSAGLPLPREVELRLAKSKERMAIYLLGYLALWSVAATALLLLRGNIQEVTALVQLLAVPVLPLLGYMVGRNSRGGDPMA